MERGIMEKEYFKNFRKFLLPNMVSMALLAAYTFTDSFVIGRKLGSTALGAMGICTPVITLTYAFGYFFGQGGAALYSIARGQGNLEKGKTVHNTALASMLVFGVLAAVLLIIFAVPFAKFLGADDTNMEYVMPYLRVVLAGIPVLMMEIFTTCYVNNDGKPDITMTATIAGVVSNVALDFLFVFGFGWGMFGAAFATVFCSLLGTLVKMVYICFKSEGLKLSVKYIRLDRLPKILQNGVASLVLESSSAIVTFVFISQSIRYYGEPGPAVYTVILNWALIAVNFVIGVAEAAQPLISLSYGKGDRRGEFVYLKESVLVAAAMGCFFFVLGYGFTGPLVTVFLNDDPELVRLACSSFRMYLPAFLIMGVSICIGSFFQAVEQAGKAFTVMLSRGILFPVGLALILPAVTERKALWAATPAAEMISAVISAVLIMNTVKKYKKAC